MYFCKNVIKFYFNNDDILIQKIPSIKIFPSKHNWKFVENIDYVDEIETDTPSLGMVRWIYDYIHNRFKSEKKEQYASEKYSKEKILKILNLTDSEIEELESIEKSEKRE